MALKSNRGFSLLEVLVTVSILSILIIFIFRSFTAALSAAQFSQNISMACLLTENKLWDIEQRLKVKFEPLQLNDTEKVGTKDFQWSCQAESLEDPHLMRLDFTVSWKEKPREAKYMLNLFTYLFKNSESP